MKFLFGFFLFQFDSSFKIESSCFWRQYLIWLWHWIDQWSQMTNTLRIIFTSNFQLNIKNTELQNLFRKPFSIVVSILIQFVSITLVTFQNTLNAVNLCQDIHGLLASFAYKHFRIAESETFVINSSTINFYNSILLNKKWFLCIFILPLWEMVL